MGEDRAGGGGEESDQRKPVGAGRVTGRAGAIRWRETLSGEQMENNEILQTEESMRWKEKQKNKEMEKLGFAFVKAPDRCAQQPAPAATFPELLHQ